MFHQAVLHPVPQSNEDPRRVAPSSQPLETAFRSSPDPTESTIDQNDRESTDSSSPARPPNRFNKEGTWRLDASVDGVEALDHDDTNPIECDVYDEEDSLESPWARKTMLTLGQSFRRR